MVWCLSTPQSFAHLVSEGYTKLAFSTLNHWATVSSHLFATYLPSVVLLIIGKRVGSRYSAMYFIFRICLCMIALDRLILWILYKMSSWLIFMVLSSLLLSLLMYPFGSHFCSFWWCFLEIFQSRILETISYFSNNFFEMCLWEKIFPMIAEFFF